MQTQAEQSIEDWYKESEITAPVNLKALCREMKITVYLSPTPGVAFCERRIIIVDSRLDRVARREQLAHEMAHILLHCGGQWFQSVEYIAKQEWQARNLAMILLMPLYLLKETIGPGDSLLSLMPLLSEKFQISADSLRFRIDAINSMEFSL